jgi:hypothetical protein
MLVRRINRRPDEILSSLKWAPRSDFEQVIERAQAASFPQLDRLCGNNESTRYGASLQSL